MLLFFIANFNSFFSDGTIRTHMHFLQSRMQRFSNNKSKEKNCSCRMLLFCCILFVLSQTVARRRKKAFLIADILRFRRRCSFIVQFSNVCACVSFVPFISIVCMHFHAVLLSDDCCVSFAVLSFPFSLSSSLSFLFFFATHFYKNILNSFAWVVRSFFRSFFV